MYHSTVASRVEKKKKKVAGLGFGVSGFGLRTIIERRLAEARPVSGFRA